jgi:hypothetical protein
MLPMFDLGKGALVGGKADYFQSKVVPFMPKGKLGKGAAVQPLQVQAVEVCPKCFSKW